ncbi:MAG: hypothetical protein ACLFVL_07775 [Candidatus Aenigmatarchaeota archaeon]
MSETNAKLKKSKSYSLEERIALGLYRNRKEKIMKTIEEITEKHDGEEKSIKELRKKTSKIDGSMSDYVIAERE